MEEKIAIIGLFVRNYDSASKVNEILHTHGKQIIARMGVPNNDEELNIISVIVRATADEISALSGSLGRLEGVTVKTMQTPV